MHFRRSTKFLPGMQFLSIITSADFNLLAIVRSQDSYNQTLTVTEKEAVTGPHPTYSPVKERDIHNWVIAIMFHCLGLCHYCPRPTQHSTHFSWGGWINKTRGLLERREGFLSSWREEKQLRSLLRCPALHGGTQHSLPWAVCLLDYEVSPFRSRDGSQALGGPVPEILRDHKTFTY